MTSSARTAATLAGLLLLLGVAAVWGWQAATAPFPSREEPAPCVDVEVSKGDRLLTGDVLVSVFNGSDRQGLAGATAAKLQTRGFVPGDTGNVDLAKRRGDGVQIWTEDKKDPAVRLVARQFAAATVVRRAELPGSGVVVVMGDDFTRLRTPAVKRIRVPADSTYCQATGTTLEE